MTTIYLTDCHWLEDHSALTQVEPYLDKQRRLRIRRLRSPLKKAQCAAAGLLLKYCFGDNAAYRYGPYGKPYLENQNTHFSIAHSDHLVILAVSDAEIGADIQVISPIRTAVLRRCFTDAEQGYIGTDATRFTQLWVQKEAYAKYTGRGLTAPYTIPAATTSLPLFTCDYQGAYIAVYGDDTAEIIRINEKDLL